MKYTFECFEEMDGYPNTGEIRFLVVLDAEDDLQARDYLGKILVMGNPASKIIKVEEQL